MVDGDLDLPSEKNTNFIRRSAIRTCVDSLLSSLFFHSRNVVRLYKIDELQTNTARRKLRMLNNAVDLIDLRIPPANRLEKLSGKLAAYHSIRINDQWRIIFKWEAGNAREVEIVDYH